MSAIINLVKKTVESYVKEQNFPDPPEELSQKINNGSSGVFITIKKQGDLRGCMGTIESEENIVKQIVSSSISACRDPRFKSIKESELPELSYEVNILKEPREVMTVSDSKIPENIPLLQPEKEGIIVKSGNKTGLLLPGIEGIDSPDKQLKLALRKAGIDLTKNYKIYKFETDKYEGM